MNFLDGYIEAGKRIRNKQARHEFYGSIIDYFSSDTGEVPEFKYEIAEAVFWGVKYSLDKARAGRTGGQANAKQTGNETPSKREANGERNAKQTAKQTRSKPPSKREANAKQTGNETRTKEEEEEEYKEEEPNGSSKKPPRFTAPTAEEVEAYATAYVESKGWESSTFVGINAERFVDFYASKGWRVGSSPMKDWKAAVRGWIARDRKEGGADDDRFAIYA